MEPRRSRWIRSPGRPDAGLRLFCLPYAGGSASVYRSWQNRLPAEVEVCPIELPGRGTRIGEPAIGDLTELLDALGPELAPWLDRPFALYGHSMGGLVAFELCRRLRSDRAPMPEKLLVSGAGPPRLIAASPVKLHELDDEAFLERIRSFNGTPAAILDDRELMALLLPAMRADFSLTGTYQYHEQAPLGCPIRAFGGLRDSVIRPEYLRAWRDEAGSSFSIQMLPDGHFFPFTNPARFLSMLQRELVPMLASSPGARPARFVA